MRSKEGLVSLGSGRSSFLHLGIALERGLVPGLSLQGLITKERNVDNTSNAKRLGVPLIVVDEDKFRTDGEVDINAFEEALNEKLRRLDPTFVSQNGWLTKTPKGTIDLFPGRIYNQHPGPKRETATTHGTQPHAIMIELVQLTGRNEGTDMIIHRVDEEWDHGETVAISHVPILDQDSPTSLQQAALPYEHLLQIEHWNRAMRDEVRPVPEPIYMRPGEEHFLIEARQKARKIFPNG